MTSFMEFMCGAADRSDVWGKPTLRLQILEIGFEEKAMKTHTLPVNDLYMICTCYLAKTDMSSGIQHGIHETCHSVTFYFMSELIFWY